MHGPRDDFRVSLLTSVIVINARQEGHLNGIEVCLVRDAAKAQLAIQFSGGPPGKDLDIVFGPPGSVCPPLANTFQAPREPLDVGGWIFGAE